MRPVVLAALLVSGWARCAPAPPAAPADPARGGHARDHLLVEFMLLKSLNRALIYSCTAKLEILRMVTALSKAGISAMLVNTESGSDLAMEKHYNRRQRTAVFVDISCPHAPSILDSIRATGTFEYTSYWLLLADEKQWAAGRALHAALRLPLSLDTALLLAVLSQGVSGVWYGYDVHTIDASKQTPLNITFLGVYSKFYGESELIHQFGDHFRYPPPLIISRDESYAIEDLDSKYAKLFEDIEAAVQGAPLFSARNADVAGAGGWRVLVAGTRVARRRDWHGAVTLRAAYVLTGKPAHMSDVAFLTSSRVSQHEDASPRYVLTLVRYMQDMYSFQVELQRAEQWAGQRNGSWVGIAGALLHGRADLGLAPMAIKPARYDALEFSGLTSVIKLSTVFRQPASVAAPTLSVFTAPLTGGAWGAALSLSALLVLLGAVAAHLETRFIGTLDNYFFDIGAIIIDFVNVFYLDGSFRSRRLWSGRVAAVSACTLGVLLMQFYSAWLLAALLAPPPSLVNSLRDLLHSDMSYKAEDIAYHRQFFKENMDNSEIAKLYHSKLTQGFTPPFISNEEGLKKVREGNFAFQGTSTSTYPTLASWSDDEVCTLDELHVFKPLQQYLTVARGSPYRQHILTALVAMHERGVSSRVKPMYFPTFPQCPPEHANAPKPVGRQFYPALQILAVLGIVSIGILIIEILISYTRINLICK